MARLAIVLFLLALFLGAGTQLSRAQAPPAAPAAPPACAAIASINGNPPSGIGVAIAATAAPINVAFAPAAVGGSISVDGSSQTVTAAMLLPLKLQIAHDLQFSPPPGGALPPCDVFIVTIPGLGGPSYNPSSGTFQFGSNPALTIKFSTFTQATVTLNIGTAGAVQIAVVASGDVNGSGLAVTNASITNAGTVIASWTPSAGGTPQPIFTGCLSLPAITLPPNSNTAGDGVKSAAITIACSNGVPSTFTATFGIALAGQTAAAKIAGKFNPASNTLAAITFGDAALNVLSLSCTSAASCNASGSLVFPSPVPLSPGPLPSPVPSPSPSCDPRQALCWTYSPSALTFAGTAAVSAGTYALTTTISKGSIAAGVLTLSGSAMVSSGPQTLLSLSNCSLTDGATANSLSVQCGKLTADANPGLGLTLLATPNPSPYPAFQYSSANGNLSFLGSIVLQIEKFSLTGTGVKASFDTKNGGIPQLSGVVTIGKGSALAGARVTSSPCATPPPQNELVGCGAIDIGGLGGVSSINGSVTIAKNASGAGYEIQSAQFAQATPAPSQSPQPIYITLGSRVLEVTNAQLTYDVPDSPTSSDTSLDPWLQNFFTPKGSTQLCSSFPLHGSMEISLKAIVATAAPVAGASQGPGTTLAVAGWGDPGCSYVASYGIVAIPFGMNSAAVITKFVAASHGRITVDNTNFPSGSFAAAAGTLQLGNAIVAFDEVGFQQSGGKISGVGGIDVAKSVEYSAVQNVGSILAGIGAFVFGIFHH